jgi:hypothetical protein
LNQRLDYQRKTYVGYHHFLFTLSKEAFNLVQLVNRDAISAVNVVCISEFQVPKSLETYEKLCTSLHVLGGP